MENAEIIATKKDIDVLLDYSVEVSNNEVVITVVKCPLENPDNSITWQIDTVSIL